MGGKTPVAASRTSWSASWADCWVAGSRPPGLRPDAGLHRGARRGHLGLACGEARAERDEQAMRARLPSTHDQRADDTATAGRPTSPGLEGVIAGETSPSATSMASAAVSSTAATGSATSSTHGTYPAVANLLWTGDWDPEHRLPTGAGPAAGDDRPSGAARPTTKPMDALRTAVSAWGATQDLPWPPTVDQARALTAFSPSALAAFARLRAGHEPIEPGSVARPRRGLPLPAQRRAARRRHGPRARRLLHRRRRARLQRLDVHGPGRHLDPLGHRVGGGRGDRDDEGPAPRRRAVRGRRPAQPDRLGRARRGVGPRRARPRRAADGLRPSRLPRLRPAGGRPAQGRRGDADTARLAELAIRGRGRRPPGPRREAPGPRRSRPTSSSTRRRS